MDEECAICKKNICPINNCVTECNHKYCLKCLIEHLKRNNTCPLCREKILEEALNQNSIDDSSDESNNESEEIASNQPEVIEIKSYEYYGKISVNRNLKHAFICLIIALQMNIIICVITFLH